MQLEFFDIPSPCIDVCQSDDKGQCLGCFRTRDERKNWISLDSDERQKVIKRCRQRKKRKFSPAKVKVVDVALEDKQPSLFDISVEHKIDNTGDIDFGDFEL